MSFFQKNSIEELVAMIRDKKISATEMVQKSLDSILSNKDSNAYVRVSDTAIREAKQQDNSNENTPLKGIPFAVKDNICVEGKETTAGSKILEGHIAPYNATVVQLLQDAGAIFVGSTNMDEFGMGSSTEHSVYGPTKNPHDKSRVAGGSSGGSAAAVASYSVPFALGSDTGGSVRQPSAYCGCVGLKPTYGALSRYGLIALASSLDAVGVITNTIDDSRTIFDILSKEKDTLDSTSHYYKGYNPPQAKNKIIVIRDFVKKRASKEVYDAYVNSITTLEEKGYVIEEIPDTTILEQALAAYYIIQPAEASSNLGRYDGIRYGLHINAESVEKQFVQTRSQGFGKECKRRIMIGTYVLSAGHYDTYYKKAQDAKYVLYMWYKKIIEDRGAAIMTPTAPTTAFLLGECINPIDMYANDVFTTPSNLLGIPAISIPVKSGGLPIGMQLMAGYNSERMLYKIGKDIL